MSLIFSYVKYSEASFPMTGQYTALLLITSICSNKGLNEIAKLFPNQVIYTSCIDEEDEKTQLLVPGIGNPLSRLSTIFQD